MSSIVHMCVFDIYMYVRASSIYVHFCAKVHAHFDLRVHVRAHVFVCVYLIVIIEFLSISVFKVIVKYYFYFNCSSCFWGSDV